MRKINKSGKQLKKIRGKDGRVRAYWTGQKETQRRTRQGAKEQPKESFLKRHGGKLAAGAALLGVAALNRHKLAGAFRGAQFAHNAIQHSSQKVGMKDRAHAMFRMAKTGFMSNRGMDPADRMMSAGHSLIQKGRNSANEWRRGVGQGFAHHMTEALGGAAAEHLGSRFGQVAGSTIGSVFGPAGAALGGFIGGHAGSYLGGRHAAPHIQRAAQWAARKVAQR